MTVAAVSISAAGEEEDLDPAGTAEVTAEGAPSAASAEEDGGISVGVLNLAGEELAVLCLMSEATVSSACEQLMQMIGGAGRIRLVLGGRLLGPQETVKELGLVPGATLQLVREAVPPFDLVTYDLERQDGGWKVQLRPEHSRPGGWALACAPQGLRRAGFRLGPVSDQAGCADYVVGALPPEVVDHFNESPTSSHRILMQGWSQGPLPSVKAMSELGVECFRPGDVVVVDFEVDGAPGPPGGRVRFGWQGQWSSFTDCRLHHPEQACLVAALHVTTDGLLRSVELCSSEMT